MRQTGCHWLAVVALSVGGLAAARAADAATNAPAAAVQTNAAVLLERLLRETVDTHFQATEKADLAAVTRTIHPDSPAYEMTLKTTEQMLGVYRLKVELLDFHLIGRDGVYALARGRQKTTRLSGPAAFTDNTVDSVYVFRQDGSTWKLWQQAVLESEFVRP